MRRVAVEIAVDLASANKKIGPCEPISNLSAGAEGQNRTADTAVFSRVLYRLSYLGASSLYLVVPFQAILANGRYTGAVA